MSLECSTRAVRGQADPRFGRAIPGRASPSLRNVRTAHGGFRHTPSPAPTRTFSRGGPPAARVPPARVAEPRTAVFSGGPGDATARARALLPAALTPGAGSRTQAAP